MPETVTILPLSVTRLDYSRLSQLLSDSVQVLTQFTETYRSETFYVTQLELLKTSLERFDAQLHRSRSSQLTEPLRLADVTRDELVTTIFSLIRSHERVKVPAIREAYLLLSPLLKQYKGMTTVSYEVESEKICHFLRVVSEEAFWNSFIFWTMLKR